MRIFIMIAMTWLGACASESKLVVTDRDVAVDPGDPGCVGPQCNPKPDPTHETVELINHIAGCRAGQRGAAEFRIGDRLVATLNPGESKALVLPHGEVEIAITEDGKTETRALSLGGSGPVQVELGCAPRSFDARSVQPLVLEGPTCGDADSIKVRAGGLDLEVARDRFQTIFLPRGTHVVRVAGSDRIITLDLGGSTIPLGNCGTSENR